MLGVIAVVVVLVVVFPLLFWVGYGVVAAMLGWLLKDNAEAIHEGSELIATNV